jgi:hypothetical protein
MNHPTNVCRPPAGGAVMSTTPCPEVWLQRNTRRPTLRRLAYVCCGKCETCRRNDRRPGEVAKSLEFDVAGLSPRRRDELFAALRAGPVPLPR